MGYPPPPQGADAHERRHAAACKREGLSYKWVNRKGVPVVQTSIGNSPAQLRKGARVLRAGGSGGDSAKDRRDADRLDREALAAANPGCLIALLTLGLGPMLMRRAGKR